MSIQESKARTSIDQIMSEVPEDQFAHLRIPLEEIRMATNNFSDANFIGDGTRQVYKGQLSVSGVVTSIAAWRSSLVNTEVFLAEISILSTGDSIFNHENILSFLGLYDEGDGKIIIVYKYDQGNGNLYGHISKSNLTWTQRLRVCVGIAHGLSYIHSHSRPIYCILKSSMIVVDNNWVPKLYARPYMSRNTSYTTSVRTSDIYDLGVVLFELVCGKTIVPARNLHDKGFSIQLALSLYQKRNLDTLIDPSIRKKMDQKSFSMISEVAYYCLKDKSQRPNIGQIVSRLEEALQVHENPIKTESQRLIQLQDIVSATRNFDAQYRIGRDRFGMVYEGCIRSWHGQHILSNFLARRLDGIYEKEVQFSKEISMLSNLDHKNIASLIGFCDENDEKIFIYEHAVHGTLDLHLRDPTLTWRQRLQICLGVARALSYIHSDVIHCDINSSKIFLDKDWEPKIFGFELSTKYPQSLRHRLLFSRYFNNMSVTPKYDVYLFGLLLFEVLYGAKDKWDEIIDPHLKKQMETQSLKNFKSVAQSCLDAQRGQRPTMDHIVKKLELVLELQTKHENLHSGAANEGTSFKSSKMNLLKIPLMEIRTATNDFHTTKEVGSGGYGTVYKATLEVLDVQRLSLMEGKSKDKLPKTKKIVAVKRIKKTSNEQGKEGFSTEIELLSRCNHPNIVPLLGFCEEDSEMILVYEYVFNGCLSDYLESRKTTNLTWAQRIQICLDIAHGLSYLHSNTESKPMIIHRDIKSENILLDENMKAKIADFGLSKFHLTYQQASAVETKMIAGTRYYMDPEFLSKGIYKIETDIYSFGVVMFEVLSRRLAYDEVFTLQNEQGLAPVARRHFNEGTLKELMDPMITQEDEQHFFTLNRGPNQDSFNSFSSIANKCLAETQNKRPKMEVIIKELQNALKLQGETVVLSRFQLKDIMSATENFSEKHCVVGLDAYCAVYKANLIHHDNKSSLVSASRNHGETSRIHTTVFIKRIPIRDNMHRQEGFFIEIEMLCSRKHPNLASLIGFCDEDHEMILVYEDGSNGSLEDYLRNPDKMAMFTWTKRLNMCHKIACGVNHLHANMDHEKKVIHGDIRSSNILLGKDWDTKIAYFGISKLKQTNQQAKTLDTGNNVAASVYGDLEYEKVGKLKKELDIYSLGVILFETFCGKLENDLIYMENGEGLAAKARRCLRAETINEMIDPKLIERTDKDILTPYKEPNQDSLKTFLTIAYKCLEETQDECPSMENIIKELEKALQFQENPEMLPGDIESAMENMSHEYYVESAGSQDAYRGLPVANVNGHTTVVANLMAMLMSRHTNCCTIL